MLEEKIVLNKLTKSLQVINIIINAQNINWWHISLVCQSQLSVFFTYGYWGKKASKKQKPWKYWNVSVKANPLAQKKCG